MKNQSWLNPKIGVKRSPIDKKGVFARKLIKKGEVISVSGGVIVDIKEYKRLKKGKFKKIDEYSLEVADGFYLVSHKRGKLETDDFFNHSCNPNAGYQGHLLVVAMRDIKPGEEITYDYAMTDCDKGDYFKCHCETKNCRGVVTGDDWKKPKLQRKYKGYFSWYIQEKINKLKGKSNRSLI